jgi:hypothetical protein
MTPDRRIEPQFSQPVRQIVMMLIVLGFAVAVGILLYPTVSGVFLSSPYLNSFIILVFLIGVGACVWQVLALIASVSWIERFAQERPGREAARTPTMLAPLASLLSERRSRQALSSSSTRSILDSVATRIEEQRDLTRYLINLLIFLGLLGTFYGLATVVPAVVETIRSLAPQEGDSAVTVFDNFMSGLEGQLAGMGTAFASSLLGLSGSLLVGLLDLFASHGQNRFYRELEEWLSSFTKLGVMGVDADEPLTGATLLGVIEQNAIQIDALREVVERATARAEETDKRIEALAGLIASPERIEETRRMQERLVGAQEKVAALLAARDEDAGRLDAETRARLRSIDTQVLRILEDMAAGRQDLVAEMRSDISGLAEALRNIARSR